MIRRQLATCAQTYIDNSTVVYKRTIRYYKKDKELKNERCKLDNKKLYELKSSDPLILEFQNLRTHTLEEIKNYANYYISNNCDPKLKYEDINFDVIQSIIDKTEFTKKNNIKTINNYYIFVKGLYFNKLMRFYYKLMNKYEELNKLIVKGKQLKKFSIFPSFGQFTIPYIPFTPTAILELIFKLELIENPRKMVIFNNI